MEQLKLGDRVVLLSAASQAIPEDFAGKSGIIIAHDSHEHTNHFLVSFDPIKWYCYPDWWVEDCALRKEI